MANGTHVRLEFISAGFRQILTGSGVQSLVQSTADSIATRANGNLQQDSEGFKSNVVIGNYGGGRYVGFVGTSDRASMIAEAEDKALSKAVSR